MDLNIVKDFVMGNGVNIALGILGVSSFYILIDRGGKLVIDSVAKKVIDIFVGAIELVDEKGDDLLEKDFPVTHASLQRYAILALQKAIMKIKD